MTGPAASPVVRGGRPAGIRLDGRLIWVWWGQDERGLDVVAARGRRVLSFETETACRAACAPAGSPPAWSPSEAGPERETGSTPERRPERETGSTPERRPERETGSTPEHRPERGSGSVPTAGPVLLLGPEHLRTPDGEPVAPGLAGAAEPAVGPEVTDLGPAQEWAAGRRFVVPAESALDLWNWGVDIARSTGRTFEHRGPVPDACYDKLVAAQVPWRFDRQSARPPWDRTQLTTLRGLLTDAIHLIRAALSARP
jgi:hypothetical protein